MNELLGARIKKLREDNGLTMEEMAKLLRVTKSRINMWENGGAVPREDLLMAISENFNVSIDYLFGNNKMEGKTPENESLQYLQRNLGKLNNENLKKAEEVLKAVFSDIFDDEESHNGL